MQVVPAKSTSTNVKVAGNACTTDGFAIRIEKFSRTMPFVATHRGCSKRRARTLSRDFWQTKYFQRFGRSGASRFLKREFLPALRADSRSRFSDRPSPCPTRRQFFASSATKILLREPHRDSAPTPCGGPCGDARRTASRTRDRRARRRAVAGYKPSLLLMRSLTACGLALPPDAFIT